MSDKPDTNKQKIPFNTPMLAVGIGIGAALGVALSNVALGVGVGVAIGVGLALTGGGKDAPSEDDEAED